MKFLNNAHHYLSPHRFKTVRVSPDHLTISYARECPYDNEVLVHHDDFNTLESQCQEIQTLLDEIEQHSDFKIDYQRQKKMFPEL